MFWNFKRWDPVAGEVPARPIELLPNYVSRARALLPGWTLQQYGEKAEEIDTMLMLSGYPFVSTDESADTATSELHTLKVIFSESINRRDVEDGFKGNLYQFHAVLALLFVEETIEAINGSQLSKILYYQTLVADSVSHAEALQEQNRVIAQHASELAKINGSKSHSKTAAIKQRAVQFYADGDNGHPWKSQREAARRFYASDAEARANLSAERWMATITGWTREMEKEGKLQREGNA